MEYDIIHSNMYTQDTPIWTENIQNKFTKTIKASRSSFRQIEFAAKRYSAAPFIPFWKNISKPPNEWAVFNLWLAPESDGGGARAPTHVSWL